MRRRSFLRTAASPTETDQMAFTGRRRDRRTKPMVKWLDRIAGSLITVGGLGTIAAVLGVFLFLVWVVVPLFSGAEAELTEARAPEAAAADLRLQADEYQAMAWTMDEKAVVRAFRLEDGSLLEERPLVEGPRPTAFSPPAAGDGLAVGLEDGSVLLARVGFESRFLEAATAPAELRELAVGRVAVHDGGIAQRTPEGQVRFQRLKIEIDEPVSSGFDSAVRLVDVVDAGTGPIFVALSEDGRLRLNEVKRRRNLLTGKVSSTTLTSDLPPFAPSAGPPSHLHLTGLGDAVFVGWPDGRLVRYDVRDRSAPVLMEELDLVDEPGETVTSAGMLLGRGTLLVGRSDGGLDAFFRTKPETATAPDGIALTRAHSLPRGKAAISALGISKRSRVVAVGDRAGGVRLLQVTTGEELLALEASGGKAVTALTFTPKEDGIVALTSAGLSHWRVDLAHPEATAASLFRPVWYEGANEPEHVWQSSSGTDDFEMKLGLLPLIFGTLKATVYSMLFGAPLALLAAVYTSEFLRHPIKARVKSSIELMASLPSVVLGFLAALVIAPWVEEHLTAVLAAFLSIPFFVLLGAYLWQLLPHRSALRWERYRLPAIVLFLPLGLVAARPLGDLLERLLFSSDIFAWLDGQTGSALGGWLIALFPASLLAVTWSASRWLAPVLRRHSRSRQWTRGTFALTDLGRFFAIGLGALLLSLVIASTLSAFGLDARSWYLGTYVQRNALVVGFIMGFAIIPIIYTIAEDALTAVPEHLRSASLGAGATPWQTAVRIIIPTAMSGLFSALMIGLGRAVGETMIVLMAAGNTPLMDWNLFNGFRTLSANIAVELPEAVRGSTHYRTLFLAALTLFAMTFFVNTLAELVRLRFRKRAFQA